MHFRNNRPQGVDNMKRTIPILCALILVLAALVLIQPAVGEETMTDFDGVPNRTITFPNGGEEFPANSNQEIKWLSNNIKNITIEYSDNDGGTWNTIVTNVDASSGSYIWRVPQEISTQYKIRIFDTSNYSTIDECDGVFSIFLGDYINVISPVLGDIWTVNSTKEIRREPLSLMGRLSKLVLNLMRN